MESVSMTLVMSAWIAGGSVMTALAWAVRPEAAHNANADRSARLSRSRFIVSFCFFLVSLTTVFKEP